MDRLCSLAFHINAWNYRGQLQKRRRTTSTIVVEGWWRRPRRWENHHHPFATSFHHLHIHICIIHRLACLDMGPTSRPPPPPRIPPCRIGAAEVEELAVVGLLLQGWRPQKGKRFLRRRPPPQRRPRTLTLLKPPTHELEEKHRVPLSPLLARPPPLTDESYPSPRRPRRRQRPTPPAEGSIRVHQDVLPLRRPSFLPPLPPPLPSLREVWG